jgi:hypothetical protein
LFIGPSISNVQVGTDNITRDWVFHAGLPKGHKHYVGAFASGGSVTKIRKPSQEEKTR